ncbi:hypothetical protein GCM10028777_18140 [Angustibacter speluncae]
MTQAPRTRHSRQLAEYYEIANHLDAERLPTAFFQTRGMHTALQAQLNGGPVLLLTDDAASLASARDEHPGWCWLVHL